MREKAMLLRMYSPDHSDAGQEVLEGKLSFLKNHKLEKEPAVYANKKRTKHPEADLQIACVQFLNLHPRILFWATPANTWVGKMTGAKLGYLAKQKRMGVKKGVPDICLFFLNRHNQPTFCFAELKSDKGTASEEQINFMQECHKRGGFSAIIRSLSDMKTLLEVAGY